MGRRTTLVRLLLPLLPVLLALWAGGPAPEPAAARAEPATVQAVPEAMRAAPAMADAESAAMRLARAMTGAAERETVREPVGDADGRELAGELAKEQAGQLDMAPIETFWSELKQKYGGYFPDGRMPELTRLMFPDGQAWNPIHAVGGLLRFFLHEVLYGGRLIVTIVLLAVFTMVLETMQGAFERNTVTKVAYAIAYMVLIVIAVNSFRVATGYAGEAIGRMVHFMLAMIPLLLTLIVSTGGVATAAMLHPLVVFMVHTVGTMVHLVVFPLLFFSAVLHLVSSITERYKVTQLANLLRSIGVYVLGGLLTLFLGVMSVQGITGSVADGVTLRTTKFVSSNFIPVVGRMFSDAADTVLSASMLVKNAVGLAGVVILLFLCAFPAVKVMTLAIIFNVSAAVMQPLGDSPITGCLQAIGRTLTFMVAALMSVGLMFFLAVTIILTAGNVSILMR